MSHEIDEGMNDSSVLVGYNKLKNTQKFEFSKTCMKENVDGKQFVAVPMSTTVCSELWRKDSKMLGK